VRSGLGIAALPYYLAENSWEDSEETSNLQEVLPELEGPTFDTYFVYPEELRQSKRIKVLRDFLLDEVEEYRNKLEVKVDRFC
jgi:DNA-binding transcriptional LysR family regulator